MDKEIKKPVRFFFRKTQSLTVNLKILLPQETGVQLVKKY